MMKKQLTPPRKKNLSYCLGIFLFFLLFSCTSNDQEINTNSSNSIVNQLKNQLKLGQFDNTYFAKNLIVNWESITTTEKEGLTIYEVPISEVNQTTIASNLFQEQLKYSLVAIKKDNMVYSYLIEAYSKKNHELFTNSLQKLKNFTGTLNIFELGGEKLGQLVVFDGDCKNPSKKENLKPLKEVINLYYYSNKIASKLPECNQIITVRVTEDVYLDHYSVWTTASGSYIGTFLTSTTLVSTSSYYASYPYDCGTNGDSSTIVYRIPSYEHNSEGIPINEDEFKANINSATPNAWDFEFITNQNTVTAKATFLFLPWAGVKIMVDQNAANLFTINNVTSDTFGLTLGYSWSQNTYNQSTVGNTTTVNVYGTLNYNMFAQGIGNVYSSSIIFQIKINNTNGHIISGIRLP